MNRTEIFAIGAGVLIIAGGVALELAGKAAPAEVWVAGTAAITGGLGLALPGSASGASSELANLASDISKLAGYFAAKAPVTTPEPAPEAVAVATSAPVPPVASTATPTPATSPVATIRTGTP